MINFITRLIGQAKVEPGTKAKTTFKLTVAQARLHFNKSAEEVNQAIQKALADPIKLNKLKAIIKKYRDEK